MDLVTIIAGHLLRADAAAAFQRALDAGAPPQVTSSWRDPVYQQRLRDGWEQRLPGYNFALRPEDSQHCKGLAIDVPGTASNTKTAKGWWTKNGSRFGFYGVTNEDWHFEYRPHQDSSIPTKKEARKMRRYGNRNAKQALTANRWNTIKVTDKGGVSVAFGAKYWDTDVNVHVEAHEGVQLRVRFYKIDYSTGKRTYTYEESKIDTPATKGKTLTFPARAKGECKPNERVRVEVYTWNTGVAITRAGYRTDEH